MVGKNCLFSLIQTKITSSFKDESCPRSSESVDLTELPKTLKSRKRGGEKEHMLLPPGLPGKAEPLGACCMSLGLSSVIREGAITHFYSCCCVSVCNHSIFHLAHWVGDYLLSDAWSSDSLTTG